MVKGIETTPASRSREEILAHLKEELMAIQEAQSQLPAQFLAPYENTGGLIGLAALIGSLVSHTLKVLGIADTDAITAPLFAVGSIASPLGLQYYNDNEKPLLDAMLRHFSIYEQELVAIVEYLEHGASSEAEKMIKGAAERLVMRIRPLLVLRSVGL